MSTAQWISLPNLGSYFENDNFNISPITIDFASDYGATVKEINGILPTGINYIRSGNTMILRGESVGVGTSTTNNFTFRITDPDGTIADRTFSLTIKPVPGLPSWADQEQWLGYAAIGKTNTFKVTAVSPNTTPVVYRLIPVPAGMSINPNTGVITYVPPTPIPYPPQYELDIEFSVRATVGQYYDDYPVYITVLGVPHAPTWISRAGSVGSVITNEHLEKALEAYDSAGATLNYTLVSSTAGFPFTLTGTGLLYGTAPATQDSTLYVFTVSATSINGSTSRTFYVQVVQDEINGLLQWRNVAELGVVSDGQLVAFDVGATSQRTYTVNHSFVGGALPPDLTLNTTQGYMAGYLEYHTEDKDYYFEIQASDGSQNLTRLYHLKVLKSTDTQFLNVSVPVIGEIKAGLVQTKNLMMPDPTVVVNSSIWNNGVTDELSIGQGYAFRSDDPNTILQLANLHLHSTTVMIGSSGNVVVDTAGNVLFYRNIVDSQALANYSIPRTFTTVYPTSLNNIRNEIGNVLGFANDGLGTGAEILPIVNPYTTGVGNVQVISPGSGYFNSPKLNVVGSGNGAVISCNISVQGITIVNGGNGWTAGQNVSVMVDRDHSFTVQVTNTDIFGKAFGFSVVDGGSFVNFPQGRRIITDGNSAIAEVECDLGVSSANIIAIGQGYADAGTTASVDGSLILPPWQTNWSPYLPVGTVGGIAAAAVYLNINDSLLAIMGNLVWRIQYITLTAEGKSWTGDTMLDENKCTFDGDNTRFTDWLEPCDTIFELNDTIFNQNNTRFDENKLFAPTAYQAWGSTIFDVNTTIFDLWDTIWDQAGPTTNSITRIRRIYRLLSPQISGNNIVA